MQFEPIKPARVSDVALVQLKKAILSGQILQGEKLPAERELAQQLRCSRMAIREAIRALEMSGFVETRQGATGGIYVKEPTFAHLGSVFLDLFLAGKFSIPELHRIRLLIEPEIASLAATNITSESADELKRALEDEKGPFRSLSENIEKRTKIHYLLAEMCGNRFLEAFLRSAIGLNREIVEAVQPEDPFAVHARGMHDPIVEAVIAGNPEAAREAMTKHALEFGQSLLKMEEAYRRKTGQLVDPASKQDE
jgi:GntR family transcriptional regulator, transcriptional repressor for pyruvate dehydrogenase complex